MPVWYLDDEHGLVGHVGWTWSECVAHCPAVRFEDEGEVEPERGRTRGAYRGGRGERRWWGKEEESDGREKEGEEGKGKGKGKARKARQGKWREEFALARSIVVAADAAWSRFVGSVRFGNG